MNTNKEPPEQKTVQSPGQGVTRKSKASQSQRGTDIKGGYLVNDKIQGMAVDLLIDNGSDLTLILKLLIPFLKARGCGFRRPK